MVIQIAIYCVHCVIKIQVANSLADHNISFICVPRDNYDYQFMSHVSSAALVNN